MARIKYYYDTETCKYERVKTSTWDVFFNLLGFFAVASIIAIGIFLTFSAYFDSPKEALLKKENRELAYHNKIITKDMDEVFDMLQVLQERDDNIYRSIFEAEPIPMEIRNLSTGGSKKYQELYESELENEQLIVKTYSKVDSLKRKIYVQTISYDEIMAMAKDKSKMLAAIPAIQPVENRDLTRLASGFGMRIHPIYKGRRMHTGIDFAAPRGTPIYATGDGKIKLAKKSLLKTGYGNQVEIDHGFGYISKYAHMQSFIVKVGQNVKRGEIIGYIGSTGGSTAPHLHYEIHKNGIKIDPIQYMIQDITDGEYQKLLELASRENQSLG